MHVSVKKIGRYEFHKLVFKRLRGKVSSYKVLNIITFLFEVLIEEILDGRKIDLKNFCTIYIKRLAPRRHFNVQKKDFVTSVGKNIIRLKLSKKFTEKLIKNLNINDYGK